MSTSSELKDREPTDCSKYKHRNPHSSSSITGSPLQMTDGRRTGSNHNNHNHSSNHSSNHSNYNYNKDHHRHYHHYHRSIDAIKARPQYHSFAPSTKQYPSGSHSHNPGSHNSSPGSTIKGHILDFLSSFHLWHRFLCRQHSSSRAQCNNNNNNIYNTNHSTRPYDINPSNSNSNSTSRHRHHRHRNSDSHPGRMRLASSSPRRKTLHDNYKYMIKKKLKIVYRKVLLKRVPLGLVVEHKVGGPARHGNGTSIGTVTVIRTIGIDTVTIHHGGGA